MPKATAPGGKGRSIVEINLKTGDLLPLYTEPMPGAGAAP